MSSGVLEIERLSYRYPEGDGRLSAALRDVDLAVGEGEFVLLAGGSGSGKSSLLRAACGLIPHFHGGEITGSIRVSGRDGATHGPAELAPLVGFVAQEPETQVVSTTVGAELELPLELRGVEPRGRARAVEEVALALGISELLERTTDNLSGGELQRVAIGAALVSRPPLLLLDEPTSQLDPLAGDELISLLRRLNEEWGVAVLVAEHRLERFLGSADRVVAMAQGAIIWDGPTAEFGRATSRAMPELMPPVARAFQLAGRAELPATTKAARALLREERGSVGVPALKQERLTPPSGDRGSGRGARMRAPVGRDVEPQPALEIVGAAIGYDGTPEPTVSGLELTLAPGERVALMGASGVGKSTVLRACAGLIRPSRGRVIAAAGVALLGQRPDDYFVRERIGDELPGPEGRAALRAVGLDASVDTDPRDLSGGQRQRLALAIAMAGRGAGGDPPGLICLDEPTRGLDPARKRDLAEWLGGLADAGAGLLVATHDVEFAAEVAERVVLMARGRVVADAAADEILADGWYFATESARITDGRAITPEGAAALIGPAAAFARGESRR